MPDLRPLRHAEQNVLAIEERAITATRAAYTALQLRLADLLLSSTPATLPIQLRTAFQETRASIRAIASNTALNVGVKVTLFAKDELDYLAVLINATADTTMASTASAGQREVLTNALIDEALLWLSQIEGQFIAGAIQLQLAQTDPLLIQQRLIATGISTDGRASIWRSGLAPLELAIVNLVWGGWNGGRQIVYQQAETQGGMVYRRQAIAAIDKRTTQCCLKVHGQIVDIDKPFQLSGTPRYGSELMWPPFHWRCRTSIVLYHEAMESIGTSTPAMIAQARREQATRGGN